MSVDPSNKLRYIEQNTDEFDKSHTADDTNRANEGRMHDDPGKNCNITPENHLDLAFFHKNSPSSRLNSSSRVKTKNS